MSGTYILRKGHAELDDLVDGAEAKIGPGAAKVYYVNGATWANGFAAGSDGNDGLSKDAPIHTLTEAIARCTDGGNDTIIVLDYWAATGETWPIAVNKDVINIIGVGAKPMWNWAALYSASDVCMDITGSHVYIHGLSFTPISSSPGVTFDDGAENVWLDRCDFPSGVQGVLLAAGDMNWGLSITNCRFFGALTVGGILINDDVVGTLIEGNIFERLAGDCIHITDANVGHIRNNTFALASNGAGLAVTLATSTSEFMVDQNHAVYGEATTTSPYDEEGTSTTNGWGLNYLNLTAITCA